MSQEGFWDHQEEANKVMQELKGLKNIVGPFAECVKRVNEAKEFLSLAEDDEGLDAQLSDEATILKTQIDALELQAHLSGPFDHANALLSINAGAGGTESCDWASMLMRMYVRHADLKNYKCETIDILQGDEAGQCVPRYGRYQKYLNCVQCRSLCRICPDAGTFFEKPCRRESLNSPVSLCWYDSGKTRRRNYCQFDTHKPRRDFPQSDGWWGHLPVEENV